MQNIHQKSFIFSSFILRREFEFVENQLNVAAVACEKKAKHANVWKAKSENNEKFWHEKRERVKHAHVEQKRRQQFSYKLVHCEWEQVMRERENGHKNVFEKNSSSHFYYTEIKNKIHQPFYRQVLTKQSTFVHHVKRNTSRYFSRQNVYFFSSWNTTKNRSENIDVNKKLKTE